MIVYPASFLGSATWNYNTRTLSWPASTTGYTQYTGGILNSDYSNSWMTLSVNMGWSFSMAITIASQSSSASIRISTNGQFRVSNGAVDLTNDRPSIPPIGGPPLYYMNAGGPTGTAAVNILEPGAPLADGDTQGIWTRSGTSGQKSYFDAIVYSGITGDPNGISSYMFSLYKDSRYQWMVTRTKTTPNSTFAGPYNPSIDVSQPASTTSQVWKVLPATFSPGGPLYFANWEYMGTGSVV